ncbi:MAG TPA: HAD family hydrolase [Polyangiaceae bacterium]|nr:HAD family hydrolase [Polyangiaceae bacterium]
MNIRIVCFDLGGVLVRICRSWAEGCRAAGLPVRRSSGGHAAGLLRRSLMQQLGTGKLDEAEWAERLARGLDGVYSPGELMRIHHAWSQREYAGVAALIDALHDAQVITSCLSNTNHAHWRRLVHRDGQRELDGEPEYPSVRRLMHQHASHLFGVAKPEPAIYAAFELAVQQPGPAILFFDDLPANVAMARTLGWKAETIDPRRETVPQIRRYLTAHGLL